jgi:hypothetical protein
MRARTAQLPRPPEGADRVIVTRDAVIVLDGASAFAPSPISPAAYADHLGTAIAAGLDASPGAPLAAILASAIHRTAETLGLRDDSGPSSTVAIARMGGKDADLLMLGDSYIAYRAGETTGVLTDDRLDGLALPERSRYRDRLAAGAGYDDTHAATLRDLQAAQRVRRNRSDGYWIASADPEAASHAITLTIPIPEVKWIALATDGTVTTARHLRLDDWDSIACSDETALAALLQRCHDWEKHDDPNGRQLPRAKRHDDKTIAVIGIP